MLEALVHLNGTCDRHQVIGRTAGVVAFLIAHQERLNSAQRGSIEIHFDGPVLKPAVHEFFGPLNIEHAANSES